MWSGVSLCATCHAIVPWLRSIAVIRPYGGLNIGSPSILSIRGTMGASIASLGARNPLPPPNPPSPGGTPPAAPLSPGGTPPAACAASPGPPLAGPTPPGGTPPPASPPSPRPPLAGPPSTGGTPTPPRPPPPGPTAPLMLAVPPKAPPLASRFTVRLPTNPADHTPWAFCVAEDASTTDFEYTYTVCVSGSYEPPGQLAPP